MNKSKVKITRPTPDEEAEIAAHLAEDPDTYEWSDEDWASAKTTQQLFPELAERARERKAGLMEQVTINLDRETIIWFKAQTGEDGEIGGTAWLALVEQTLRAYVQDRNDQAKASNIGY
jgi:hypothetical protein